MVRQSFDGIVRKPKISASRKREFSLPVKPNPEIKRETVRPPEKPEPRQIDKKKKKWSWKKTVWVVVMVAVTTGVFMFGRAFFAGLSVFDGDDNKSSISKIQGLLRTDTHTLAGEDKDRVDILLAGIGGEGHEGASLTDSIIIASIRPSDGNVAILSIPRDRYVEDPISHDHVKINKLNHYGEIKYGKDKGMENLRVGIEEVIGEDIEYTACIDFDGFKEIIDYLDEIEINVENSFVDKEYPTENYGYQTIIFEKGLQSMDGDTALKYARSRHGYVTDGSGAFEGSDYARSQRQQNVIMGIKEKLLSTETFINPQKLQNVFSSLDEHLATDLTLEDALRVYNLLKDISLSEISTKVVSTDNFLKPLPSIDGASLVVPTDGMDEYDEIHQYVAHIFNGGVPEETDDKEEVTAETTDNDSVAPEDTIDSEAATIEIRNGSGVTGLAQRLSLTLKSDGLNVRKIGNAERFNYTTTLIYSMNEENPATQRALEDRFGVSVETSPPLEESDYDFIIVLGTDQDDGQ